MKFIFLLILVFFILSCNTVTKKHNLDGNISIEVSTDSTDGKGIRKFTVINGIIKDSIVEYLKIDGKEYANQIWLVNKNKDTIGGNYFRTFINDTTTLGEVTRLRFELTDPAISNQSDMYILIPKDDDKLKNDFSNLFELKLDTFPSLKNDGILHPEISELDLSLNHITEFGIKYGKAGEKRVRGVIVERGRKDSIGFERRLFFNSSFYIKD